MKPMNAPQFRLEITERGYLILPLEIASEYFAEDVCVALLKENELWILPINNNASGGLLIKQRNLRGDRSVLVWETLPENYAFGHFEAFWDKQNGAMRISLEANGR